MRSIALFSILALGCAGAADWRLYTCMATTRSWVVGARLLPSGIFFRAGGGAWTPVGYSHPYIAALDWDPRDPSTLYLAAGNGLIRAARGGSDWKILTGWEVTELRDVAVDRGAPGTIYFAHTAGIRVTHDGGATWADAQGDRRHRFTESVRVDRERAGRLVAGTESGILVSEDGGRAWRVAGAAGFQVMHIEQSPRDACQWMAVTQKGGIFTSSDCGRSFESAGNAGVDRNLYDISFDPARAGRIAVAGWGPGVLVSEDGGKSWVERKTGLPRPDVWSVAFDPAHPGRLYASVHEEAVYVSDDAGVNWRRDGLEGSVVFRMKFVPAEASR